MHHHRTPGSGQHDRQYRPAQPADGPATQRNNLQQVSRQQTGVQDHHHRVVPRTEFAAVGFEGHTTWAEAMP